MSRATLRQGTMFVAVSGGGWLLDVCVFMLLSGPGGLTPFTANTISGSCGALFVFAVSARGIFRRNRGSMLQKVAVLLAFNFVVILISSFVLAALAGQLAAFASDTGWTVPPAGIRLAAKVLVTPFTLVLNFLVVRFLLERFIGLMRPGAPRPEIAE